MLLAVGRRAGGYLLSAFDFPASDGEFHCRWGNSSSPAFSPGFNIFFLTFVWSANLNAFSLILSHTGEPQTSGGFDFMLKALLTVRVI